MRTEKGLSIHQFAKKAGLTSSFISQLERSLVNPSLTSLVKIADALNIPTLRLLSSSQKKKPSDPVNRRETRRKIVVPNSRVVYQFLSPDTNRLIEALLAEIEPYQEGEDELVTHEGEEFVYVAKGELTIRLGKNTYFLKEGDSIQFSSTVPHNFNNPGKEKTLLVIAQTPPSF